MLAFILIVANPQTSSLAALLLWANHSLRLSQHCCCGPIAGFVSLCAAAAVAGTGNDLLISTLWAAGEDLPVHRPPPG